MQDTLKIQIVELRKRSIQGAKQYNPKTRLKLFPYTFHANKSLGDVSTKELNSKKKIADLVWYNYGEGTYDVRGVVPNKKARFGRSMKTIVRLELKQGMNEYDYDIVEWKPMRLPRYKKILGWGDKSVY